MEFLRGQRILLQDLDFEVDMMRSMLPKIMEVQNYLQMQSLKGKKLAHRTLDSQEIAALPY